MAENKYELWLIPTKKERKIYPQPWYKERIHTKFIKSRHHDDPSLTLNGKRWTFIKDGLDDFRDGLPPIQDDDIFLKGDKGLGPNIHGANQQLSSIKQSVVKGRFTKDEVCFSKSLPLQQQKRDHINDIEYGLTQHPLALYPHLEESLPPDLFEDVVDLLDPEMNTIEGEADEDEFYEEHGASDEQTSRTKGDTMSINKEKEQRIREIRKIMGQKVNSNRPKNPYRWQLKKEEVRKENRKTTEPEEESATEDTHIKYVTKDFCDWVSGLGGETNNIEESTIMSLFASGYETKPALSVPIHVVELTNVPQELRMSANVPLQNQGPRAAQDSAEKGELRAPWLGSMGAYKPSWLKFRYGAWYLPQKMWRLMPAIAKLEDPKKLKEQEMSDAKKRSQVLDIELAPMHGAKAFMEFVDNKPNSRKPELLTSIGVIIEKQEREEKERQENEQMKQAKQRALNSLKEKSGRKNSID